MLASKVPKGMNVTLVVARRPLNSRGAARFTLLPRQQLIEAGSYIEVAGLTELDGEYVVIVVGSKSGSTLGMGYYNSDNRSSK